MAQTSQDEKSAKTVLDCLVRGDYTRVTTFFDANFKKVLSADKIKKGWEAQRKTVGTFQKQLDIRTHQTGDGRTMVVITGKFTQGRLDLQVFFSPQHRVNGLLLTPRAEIRIGSSKEAAARLVVTQMSKGQFDKVVVNFDRTMTEKLPARELSKAWDRIKQSAGAFQSIQGAVVVAQGGYEIVTVTCQFARAILDTRVVYDKAGKIAGLFFVPHQP